MRALRHKYTQKTMGGPTEDIFRHTSIDADSPHDVPVENFLNAQCKRRPQLLVGLGLTMY